MALTGKSAPGIKFATLGALLLTGLVGLASGSARALPQATTLDCGSVESAILGRGVNVCVVLPADYSLRGTRRYPVLYYLHGLFENEQSWSERGGKDILDGLVSSGSISPYLVVLPDGGRSFYVNSYDGRERYDDFFIQELIPAIDKKYRTIPQVAERGIGGTSMGGYGALHLAMRHAEVFGSASAQSAALLPALPHPLPTDGRWGFYARVLQAPFGNPLNESWWDANNPLKLAEDPPRFAHLKLYFDCGDQDRYGFNEGAAALDKILTEKGFSHEYHLRAGGHGWSYLGDYMKYALEFHWKAFSTAER